MKSIFERKFKIHVVLGIFIFLSIVLSGISHASTWQDVLTAYYSAKVEYPLQKIWIEGTTSGYRLWRRPKNTTAFMYRTYYVNGVVTTDGGTVKHCVGDRSEYISASGESKYQSSYTRQDYKYCDGSSSSVNGSAANLFIEMSECWTETVYNSTVNCKSADYLIQEFFPIEQNCTVGNTMQVGFTVYGGLASKGCDCTPEGTVFDSAGINCKYKIITGDPATSLPPTIPSNTPGLTVITNTETSPPVTNPDNSTTTTTTVTYPDNSQDVKTSNTVNNPDGTSTIITTIERFVGGASIGTTSTSTTTAYTDGSTRTTGTTSTGTTTTTLTGGNVTQTQRTYISGLTTTDTTGGTGGTTGGTGTGTGGTGGTGTGGSVWEDPPPGITVPSVPGVDPSVYSSLTDVPEEKDIKTLVTSFMAQSPLVAAVRDTRVEILNEECSFTTQIWGKDVVYDFCNLASFFYPFGVAFVLVCTFRSFFIIFGVES